MTEDFLGPSTKLWPDIHVGKVLTDFVSISYLVGFGVACYATARFFLSFLSEKTKNDILQSSELNTLAQREVFIGYFNSVYGHRHLSIRCVWRSSIISLISCLSLWLIFKFNVQTSDVSDPLTQYGNIRRGVFGASQPFGFTATVYLALLINIVPDYLSLSLTRIFLYLGSSTNRSSVLFIALISDLIFSATLAYFVLYGFQYLVHVFFIEYSGTWSNFTPIRLWDVLAFRTPLSVFFYTSVLPTFFALLVFCGIGTLRIFLGTSEFRPFDVKENFVAILSVAIGASAFLFATTISIAAIRTNGVTLAEKLFCEAGSNSACTSISQWGKNNEQVFYYQTLGLKRLCESKKDADSCFMLASKYKHELGLIGQIQSKPLYERSCSLGNTTACNELAIREISKGEQEADYQAALSYAKRGCFELTEVIINGQSCNIVGWLSVKSFTNVDIAGDPLSYFVYACWHRSDDGCLNMYTLALRKLKKHPSEQYFNSLGCVRSEDRSCVRINWPAPDADWWVRYDEPLQTIATYFRQKCAESLEFCSQIASMRWNDQIGSCRRSETCKPLVFPFVSGGLEARRYASELVADQCNQGIGLGCLLLSDFSVKYAGLPQAQEFSDAVGDFENARQQWERTHLERACELGEDIACLLLVK